VVKSWQHATQVPQMNLNKTSTIIKLNLERAASYYLHNFTIDHHTDSQLPKST